MSVTQFRDFIIRRIRISEREIRAIVKTTKKRKHPLIDYHSGCIGMGYSLLSDLGWSRAATKRPRSHAVAAVGAKRKKPTPKVSEVSR